MKKIILGFKSIADRMDQSIFTNETRVEFDENGDNGHIFSGTFIPDELISDIFTYYMDAKSLLNCQRVCKRWNMITTDYVWRKKASIKTGHSFTTDEPFDWKEYYIMYVKCGKNLIKNHSGENGLRNNWHILNEGGDRWVIEHPPTGAPQLPSDSEFQNSQHCFVTTFYYCEKFQVVDLVKEGFSTNILDNIQPSIEIGEWYSCRWDCPALYKLRVELKDSNTETLDSYKFQDILMDDRQNVWFKTKHVFKNYGQGLRYVFFTHGGKDRRFWAGHYGSKMARAYVKVIFSNSTT